MSARLETSQRQQIDHRKSLAKHASEHTSTLALDQTATTQHWGGEWFTGHAPRAEPDLHAALPLPALCQISGTCGQSCIKHSPSKLARQHRTSVISKLGYNTTMLDCGVYMLAPHGTCVLVPRAVFLDRSTAQSPWSAETRAKHCASTANRSAISIVCSSIQHWILAALRLDGASRQGIQQLPSTI